MSSSSPQNSDEPSGLLQILVAAFFGFFLGSFSSRRRAPNNQSMYSNHNQDTTDEHANRGKCAPKSLIRVVVESLPPTPAPHEEEKAEKKRDRRPQWWMLGVNFLTLCA